MFGLQNFYQLCTKINIYQKISESFQHVMKVIFFLLLVLVAVATAYPGPHPVADPQQPATTGWGGNGQGGHTGWGGGGHGEHGGWGGGGREGGWGR